MTQTPDIEMTPEAIIDAVLAYNAGCDREVIVAALMSSLDLHGYVIVPKEPTPDMIEAVLDLPIGEQEDWQKCWAVLLRAAAKG